jgi:hypothetical protein
MAIDDFYTASWSQRMNELEVERADAVADLSRAKANGDYGGAGEAIERLASIDARAINLANIGVRYENSQMPPAAPARPDHDLTPVEAMKVAGLDPNKTEDVNTYNSGVRRLHELKSLGMYRE